VKASGIEGKDSRNAVVALFRIGMSDAGGGKVAVENINASRQVSEPGAKLQLTNNRTGEKTEVVITETGGVPPGGNHNRPGTFKFAEASYQVIEGQAFATISVERSQGESGAVPIAYSAASGSPAAGQGIQPGPGNPPRGAYSGGPVGQVSRCAATMRAVSAGSVPSR